ncbi:MAG TPA: FecR domain-containing protein [Methylomirabilota bacterium]|nr:FecR domain-containing protein [Methylomirabilota bacterium]
MTTSQGPPQPYRPKIHRLELRWHTVTYKTVAAYAAAATVIVVALIAVLVPSWSSAVYKKVANVISDNDAESAPLSQKQARFVNLDGKVQVKKVNSVQWVDADFRTTLDRGDLVQTGSDGAARITFADGTFYTVKSDTLVTVEENNVTKESSNTAVRINVGEVNLQTPNWTSPNSQAAVSMEDTKAMVRSNTRASMKNDPARKESEVNVSNGFVEVKRGNETIDVGAWEKATIPEGQPIQKANVLAPPEPIDPLNLAPIIVPSPKTAPVHFEWKPVQDAVSYTLRVSTTAMFTNVVAEKKISTTSADVTGLDAGDYFWSVSATDSKKRVSEASSPFKFTLVAQGKSQEMLLEIEATQIHGRMVEIIGRTEPGAALIVNGQAVPNISPDGKFTHFTEQLQPGQQTIVITGQNRRGGTAIQRVPIVIPK